MPVEPISPAGSIVEDPRFLSPRIDFIAAIDAVEPVSAQRIVDSAEMRARPRTHQPVRWIGYDEASGEWQPISGQQGWRIPVYPRRHAARRPPGTGQRKRPGVFATAMQDLADQLTGIADLPRAAASAEAALQLDPVLRRRRYPDRHQRDQPRAGVSGRQAARPGRGGRYGDRRGPALRAPRRGRQRCSSCC